MKIKNEMNRMMIWTGVGMAISWNLMGIALIMLGLIMRKVFK